MIDTQFRSTDWRCSSVRMVLSALDDYHFAWLHENVLGDRSLPFAPERRIEEKDCQINSSFTLVQPANVTNSVNADNGEISSVDYKMVCELPLTTRLIKKNPDGLYVIHFFPCPS